MSEQVASRRKGQAAIPSDVYDVFSIFEKHGYDAYIVGGAVRDILLGRAPSDYDFATSARPKTVMNIFAKEGWRVIPKGIEYGVVSVVHPTTWREFEIATFRREYYPFDYKRRVVRVEFAKTIEEDLARRDFTINALAMDQDGNIVDPFGGTRDLRQGVIRFVGDPAERIREDPLRMLRAVRFSVELGFRVDSRSFDAIAENSSKLAFVSRERIGDEIWKALSSKSREPEKLPKLLLSTGLWRVVIPDLKLMAETRYESCCTSKTLLEHTVEAMRRGKRLGLGSKFMAGLLLYNIGKPFVSKKGARNAVYGPEVVGAERAYNIILYLWRRPSSAARFVAYIVRHHSHPYSLVDMDDKSLVARMVAEHGKMAVYLLFTAYADTGHTRYMKLAITAMKEANKHKPLLNGRKILSAYGVPPGPIVGELKKKLYEIQIKENVITEEELISIACMKYGICPKEKEKQIG